MTKLTDLQSLLLAHAARYDDGALTALPGSNSVDPARVMTLITQLFRRGLLEEREVQGGASTGAIQRRQNLRCAAAKACGELARAGIFAP